MGILGAIIPPTPETLHALLHPSEGGKDLPMDLVLFQLNIVEKDRYVLLNRIFIPSRHVSMFGSLLN